MHLLALKCIPNQLLTYVCFKPPPRKWGRLEDTGIFIRHLKSGVQYVISTQFHTYAPQRLTSLITKFLFRYHTEITESHSGTLLVPEIVENPTSAVLRM